jgi:hypothetical protein
VDLSSPAAAQEQVHAASPAQPTVSLRLIEEKRSLLLPGGRQRDGAAPDTSSSMISLTPDASDLSEPRRTSLASEPIRNRQDSRPEQRRHRRSVPSTAASGMTN